MECLITIIVCSLSSSLRNQLERNIINTIGCTFEFLYIDNSIEKKGICQVYNELAYKAKGRYLCFIHEDVLIDTIDWGNILINKASDNEVGVIGFAGNINVNGLPYWIDERNAHYYFVQHFNSGEIFIDYTKRPIELIDFSRTTVLDGMFLFCRKEVWEEIKFDDRTFVNFHLYDIDFTFSCGQKYQNYISQNIVIHHYSLGNLNRSYFESLIDFYKKWESRLPLVKNIKKDSDRLMLYKLLLQMFRNNISDVKFIKRYLTSIGYYSSFLNKINVEYLIAKSKFKSK